MGWFGKLEDAGSISQQGIDDNALQVQIDKLSERVDANDTIGSGGGSGPEPCATFVIGYSVVKRRLRAQFCINCPSGTETLKVVICPTLKRNDAAEFEKEKISDNYIVEEFQKPSGHVEFDYSPVLEYSTQYDLVRIVAISPTGLRTLIPLTDPAFNSPPIVQFTTPAQFNAPSAPSYALIGRNALDLKTVEHDAFVKLAVWAPLSATNAPQTWIESLVDEVQVELARPDYNPVEIEKHIYTITADDTTIDPTSTPPNRGVIRVRCGDLRTGAPYGWLRNTATSHGSIVSSPDIVITAAPNTTSPTTITTSSAHGLSTGNFVVIANALGNTAINGAWTVTVLNGTQFTIPIAGNGAYSGSGIVSIAFRGANFNVDPSALTSTSLQVLDTDPYDGKHRFVNVLFTQPSTVVALKRITVRKKITGDSDTTYVKIFKYLPTDDEWHTPGAKVLPLGVTKLKSTINYTLETTITAAGDLQTVFTTAIGPAASEDILQDTDRPATMSAPTAVGFIDGNIKVEAEVPASNFNSIVKYRYVLSTSAAVPDRDNPTGGTIVKLRKGSLMVLFQRPLSDVSALTFSVRVQALNSVGWSEWSAAATVLGSTLGRPLQDVIGTGVPILPERQELISTSGTGHTSTTFILTGRAEVDDFFNGMALHIPSFDVGTAGEKTSAYRMITDWVLSTQTLTVSPAFDSTPSGATAFEINRIAVAGDTAGKSGTGHTTTTFGLLSPASNVTGFYNGWSIYVPSQVTGDQIRKVFSYDGPSRTITFDLPVTTGSANNVAYLLVNGSLGWSGSNENGSVAPVPFRWWLNTDGTVNLIETITPTADANGYSLQQFEIQVTKKQATPSLRIDKFYKLASGGGAEFLAPGAATYTPMVRIRWQNLYREGGSDGYSDWSYYVRMSRAGEAAFYDPTAFPPLVVDYQGKSSWPDAYPTY